MGERETSFLGGPGAFPETSWSLIESSKDPDAAACRLGLDRLYRRYWGPVYRFIRHDWNRPVDEAKDLTQAFFLTFIDKQYLDSVDASRGRFRNFVLAALQNFLRNERRAARAKKRAPAGGLASLDDLGFADDRVDVPDPSADEPCDRFVADWKRTVLANVLDRLRARAAERGKTRAVDLFIRYDLDRPADEPLTYGDLAAERGLTIYQVTNDLHWARRSYREVFVEEIGEQCVSADDVRAEALELFGIDLDA